MTFIDQSIAATRLPGNIIKIDDDRDTSAPGANRFGVTPSQEIPIRGNFNSANPVSIFAFTLDLDSNGGVRGIDSLFQPTFPGQAFTIYTTPTGGQVRLQTPSVFVIRAEVEVVPAPGAVGVLAGLGLLAAQRRRA